MKNNDVSVEPWPHPHPPTDAELRQLMAAEDLQPYLWSNAPGDTYAPHTHSYHKVIYVVYGSITFGLTSEGKQVSLKAGDRLDLPPNIMHDAQVGPEGVACLEGHRF